MQAAQPVRFIHLNPNRMQRRTVRLRRGQAVVIRCCRTRRFPVRVIRLRPGDSVRVICGNSTAVVTCGRPLGLIRTVTIRRGQTAVVICR
jgi:hypothetical protein